MNESKELTNNTVVQSNGLIAASQSLTLNEKRLVVAAISKLDPKKDLPKNGVRIYAEEMVETFGVDEKNAYRLLQQAGRSLIRRIWTIKGRSPVNGKQSIIERHWVIEAEYQEGEGWVRIMFHPKTAPFLIKLSKNFTSYKLKTTSALRSMYSWRMLENMARHVDGNTGKGKWAVYVDDFHRAMDTPPSLRKKFTDLRRRVIEPAIKELKKDWVIKYSVKKRGRKISTLIFTFERENQQDLF